MKQIYGLILDISFKNINRGVESIKNNRVSAVTVLLLTAFLSYISSLFAEVSFLAPESMRELLNSLEDAGASAFWIFVFSLIFSVIVQAIARKFGAKGNWIGLIMISNISFALMWFIYLLSSILFVVMGLLGNEAGIDIVGIFAGLSFLVVTIISLVILIRALRRYWDIAYGKVIFIQIVYLVVFIALYIGYFSITTESISEQEIQDLQQELLLFEEELSV